MAINKILTMSVLSVVVSFLIAGCSQNLDRTNPLDPYRMNQDGENNGSSFIDGHVRTSSLAGIQGAAVTTSPVTWTVYTDSTGYYRFDSLQPGNYIINVSKTGYQTLSRPVVLGNNGMTQDFTLN
ncbi:MAG: carboxypeptidase-like regulatory domain-containing protein [Candidatus Firestonebacteria bacterium]